MNKLNARIVILFLFVLFAYLSPALAEEKPLTWIECVIIAQKVHPQIIAAEEKLNQAKSDKALNKSGLFPQITANGSSSTSKEEQAKSSKTNSLSVSASQLIFDGSKTSSDVRVALENIKASNYSLEVVSSDVRLNLRSAFAQLLRAQELIGLTENIAGRRKDNLELVRLRYEAGMEHKGAWLTAQADFAQSEYDVSQARRALELSQSRLNRELGTGKYEPIKVQGDFLARIDIQDKPDIQKLAEENPFLKELIAKKEAARFGIKKVQAEYYPQVYADASAGRSDREFLPEKKNWSAGLSVSLPIFEGGARKAKLDKSESVFKQSDADLRSGKDSVIFTLEEAWTNLSDTQEKVAVQKKFLDASLERAKIAQAQYSNGLIIFDDWTIIEDSLVNARKAYLDALANAMIAEANWVQAKGGKIDYEE